jgi:hypothetical protein
MAEGHDCPNSLVGQRACREPSAGLKNRVGHVLASQKPDLDDPGKPKSGGEIGQLGAFRGGRKVDDVLNARGKLLFEAKASPEALLSPGTEHLEDLLRSQAGELVVAHAEADILPRPPIASALRAVLRKGNDGENSALAFCLDDVSDGGDFHQVGVDSIRSGRVDVGAVGCQAERKARHGRNGRGAHYQEFPLRIEGVVEMTD